MIRIYQAQDIQQANLIVHFLEQHDLKVIILNQYTQGALGELP
ncbi:MAG: putative signal transducing protein, partial [Thiohalomonadales bacterium]